MSGYRDFSKSNNAVQAEAEGCTAPFGRSPQLFGQFRRPSFAAP